MHECPVCGKEFRLLNGLLIHIGRLHKDPAYTTWPPKKILEELQNVPTRTFQSAEDMPKPYYEALIRKFEKESEQDAA